MGRCNRLMKIWATRVEILKSPVVWSDPVSGRTRRDAVRGRVVYENGGVRACRRCARALSVGEPPGSLLMEGVWFYVEIAPIKRRRVWLRVQRMMCAKHGELPVDSKEG